ncbi:MULTISPECIES: hypothetical protein [unclassified Streptomyces]|uniref:hypothetical protein n=1 Tax=unclassified Streptomyces TaxID=2593676 RepID=UPI003D90F7D3
MGNLQTGGRTPQPEDASPVQVAAADHLLQQEPFGPDELFIGIDPTAAAVAAAHWLTAAADVAAEASGLNLTQVVLEADNIEALTRDPTPTGPRSAAAHPRTGSHRHRPPGGGLILAHFIRAVR